MTKVLVVDDEPDAVGLLREFLRRKGLHVATAARGDEALTKIRQDPPDIVLLDISMPGMDGLEVLRRIQRSEEARGPDVIMLTAHAEMGREAMELGAFDYVLKPVDLDYLDRVLWWNLKLR